jgi:hypothetical protein
MWVLSDRHRASPYSSISAGGLGDLDPCLPRPRFRGDAVRGVEDADGASGGGAGMIGSFVMMGKIGAREIIDSRGVGRFVQ